MYLVIEEGCCVPPTILGRYRTKQEADDAAIQLALLGITAKVIKEE